MTHHAAYLERPAWLLVALCLCAADLHAADCGDWQAVLESVENVVEVQNPDAATWLKAAQGAAICGGATIHVGEFSRAALRLPDGSLLRLDQKTSIKLPMPGQGSESWVELIRGFLHVISRDPRSLRFSTPYANAGLEGTEFVLQVMDDRTEVTVVEGEVRFSNDMAALFVPRGRRAAATRTGAPTLANAPNPFDRAAWTPYFPPIVAGRLPAASGRPAAAERADAAYYARRAASRLAVGGLAGAELDIEQAETLDSRHPLPSALRASIALAGSDRDQAAVFVRRALERGPNSPEALIAASYLQQATLDIRGAVTSLEHAIAADPTNALAWARLAEVHLMASDRAVAIAAVDKAAELDAMRDRVLTVRGFIDLGNADLDAAIEKFRSAIELEQGAPLPRLGLSLALIRRGDLTEGRVQLEIAVILDPLNALTRSYMGRVYAAEHRQYLTDTQLELARQLDADDPTAYLYEALTKQAENRPVEAFRAYRAATENNASRAVFRSRLQIDEDLASRSAALAQVFNDLGYSRLALLEGWKTLTRDPADYSAHRLVADAYSTLPRHQIARVNELFLAHLLQPINLTPIQPQLAESNSFILDSVGPRELSHTEFAPVVSSNGLRFQASGITTANDTDGYDVTAAGLHGRSSYSFGHFRYSTGGFRPNNDFEQEVSNAFVQLRPRANTSVQLELRTSDIDKGDTRLLFDSGAYLPRLRQTESIDSARLGLHHIFNARNMLVGSLERDDSRLFSSPGPGFALEIDRSGLTIDLQSIHTSHRWRLVSGIRHFTQDETESRRHVDASGSWSEVATPFSSRQSNVYSYASLDMTPTLTAVLGLSADSLAGRAIDRDSINPKLGFLWEPRPETVVRVGAFKTVQGPFLSKDSVQPRLEPGHVVGLNQYFFGSEGEKTWRHGVAIDHSFSPRVYGGLELSVRDVESAVVILGSNSELIESDESWLHSYLYWLPARRLAFGAEYVYEAIDNNGAVSPEGYSTVRTHRLPLRLSFFADGGLRASLTGTYVDQRGIFDPMVTAGPISPSRGSDEFWIFDAAVEYRLPKRRGAVSLAIVNLLDENFQYQDLDPENPRILPDRMLSARFTLSY
jgi:tetratricopeptide (TPR) repeat protein